MLLVKDKTGQLILDRDSNGNYTLFYIYKKEENLTPNFLTQWRTNPTLKQVRNFLLSFIESNIQNAYTPITYKGDKKATKQHLKKEHANFYRFLLRMAQKL